MVPGESVILFLISKIQAVRVQINRKQIFQFYTEAFTAVSRNSLPNFTICHTVFIIRTSAGTGYMDTRIKQPTQLAIKDKIKEATKRMGSKHKAEDTISMPESSHL